MKEEEDVDALRSVGSIFFTKINKRILCRYFHPIASAK